MATRAVFKLIFLNLVATGRMGSRPPLPNPQPSKPVHFDSTILANGKYCAKELNCYCYCSCHCRVCRFRSVLLPWNGRVNPRQEQHHECLDLLPTREEIRQVVSTAWKLQSWHEVTRIACVMRRLQAETREVPNSQSRSSGSSSSTR